MRRIGLVLLMALAMTLSASAFATTYYVATNGLDTNPGTQAQPWGTIQYAVNTIAAGDTAVVMPGTYAGCRIESSGTAVAPKTLTAQTVGTVNITTLSASARHSGLIEVENFSAGVNYWVINGFTCNGANGLYRPIDVRSTDAQKNSHITVTNNTAFGALSTGIACGHTDYLDVQHNTSYNNTHEHGTYMNNSSDYGIIAYTLTYSNYGSCMHFNGDRRTGGGDGKMQFWVIEKNVGHDCTGAAGINMDGVSDSRISNNLMYNTAGNGITFYATDASQASSNDLFYNNTFVMPATARNAVLINSGAVGNKVKNNILYDASTSKASICTYSSAVAGFQSDYNVVVDRFSINNGSSLITLAAWRAYGYDAHSIISTPAALFVNPAGNNYHLLATSPAKDAGTTLVEVTDDLDGVSRPQGGIYDIGAFELISGPPGPVSITTTSLPAGTVGVAYSATLTATGGVPPYTWSLLSGSLPNGLSLAASGVISGTPTTAGTAYFTPQVADSQQPPSTDSKALSILINTAPVAPTITTTSLPNGTRGSAYSATVQATGGTLPYVWSITVGSLPNGLSLNSSTGTISGTPSKRGTKSFTVRCTDAASQYDEQALSITIN